MNNSEWAERRREYAQAAQHECGLYLPRTAGEQVRFVALSILGLRESLIDAESWTRHNAMWLLRNHVRRLHYWQWQAWRTGK
jgi:hypothetical protein